LNGKNALMPKIIIGNIPKKFLSKNPYPNSKQILHFLTIGSNASRPKTLKAQSNVKTPTNEKT
jgi:hypothetical protein